MKASDIGGFSLPEPSFEGTRMQGEAVSVPPKSIVAGKLGLGEEGPKPPLDR